jgi:hypothetical protein
MLNKKLLPVVKQLANDSNAMIVKISLDGTWQRRNHVSHTGVVSAISLDPKKCLNVEILSDNMYNRGRNKISIEEG